MLSRTSVARPVRLFVVLTMRVAVRADRATLSLR
jgi:hypothetical protein